MVQERGRLQNWTIASKYAKQVMNEMVERRASKADARHLRDKLVEPEIEIVNNHREQQEGATECRNVWNTGFVVVTH